MALALGLAMMFAAILIGRAAKIAIPLATPPWWAANDTGEIVLSLAIVTLFTGGLAAAGTWVLGGGWRATSLATLLGLAADVAVYLVVSRAIKAWAQRVRAPAPAAPIQPQPSGVRSPLKRAA